MQIIQFGYGFTIPYSQDIINQLNKDIILLERGNADEIKYCLDESLKDNDPNKKIFVYLSGYRFDNGIIPYSFLNFTNYMQIPTRLKDGTTKNLDQLYKLYISKNINYCDISWKFFSYYSCK